MTTTQPEWRRENENNSRTPSGGEITIQGLQRKVVRALGVWRLAATIWSAVDPADWATWFFELFLGAGGVIVLVAIAPRFPFSTMVYATAAVHYLILAAGAKYTYRRDAAV